MEVAINALDDFHPDRLYQSVELFSRLAGLRKLLNNPSTFAQAAKGMQSWPKTLSTVSDTPTHANPRGAPVPIGKLDDFARLIGRPARTKPTPAVGELIKRVVAPHVVAAPNPELHLIGRTTDEACDLVERFLDDAFLAGLGRVRLVHGKGTGALRKAVRDLLTGHPLVDSFRDGEPSEGGTGATVAALRVG